MLSQGQGKPWIHKQFEPLWDDLRIAGGQFFTFGFGNDPTNIAWKTVLEVTAFQVNDELGFSAQMPHRYKEGTDLKLHGAG